MRYILDIFTEATIHCRYIYMLTFGSVWLYLLPGTEAHSSLSVFLRLLGPLTSDLPIGDVLTHQKDSYLKLFTYAFAAHPICFSACWRTMETVGELSGEPFCGERHCGFFTAKYWV